MSGAGEGGRDWAAVQETKVDSSVLLVRYHSFQHGAGNYRSTAYLDVDAFLTSTNADDIFDNCLCTVCAVNDGYGTESGLMMVNTGVLVVHPSVALYDWAMHVLSVSEVPPECDAKCQQNPHARFVRWHMRTVPEQAAISEALHRANASSLLTRGLPWLGPWLHRAFASGPPLCWLPPVFNSCNRGAAPTERCSIAHPCGPNKLANLGAHFREYCSLLDASKAQATAARDGDAVTWVTPAQNGWPCDHFEKGEGRARHGP